MTAQRSTRQLVRTALVGLVLIALAVGLALNASRLPIIGSGSTYRAEFTDASGLVKGEDVRVAGIKVGTVSEIRLSGPEVIVSFTVKGVPLGRTTTAGIALQTLLGQHYIDLRPSGSGELPAGATIPLDRTSTPINIVPAFNRVATRADSIDTAQMTKAIGLLADTLRGSAPQVGPLLRGLSRISTTVNSRDQQIRQLFRRASAVSGTVASRDHQIAELIAASAQVLSTLHRRRSAVDRIIAGTSALARELAGLVRDTSGPLGGALKHVDAVLRVLRSDRRQIDRIITYAGTYAREFTGVGGSGRWFDTVIKVPRGLALCTTDDAPTALSQLLDPILSSANDSVNHSQQPCLPLGPATGGR